jgi:hypothetical protein
MYRMVDIPIKGGTNPTVIDSSRKMPPPVFPGGSLVEVQDAVASGGPFYVVTTGFRVGVWRTWYHGAENVTDGCPGNRHGAFDCDFATACRMFMNAVASGSVFQVQFRAQS